ncbi:ACBP2 [Symbiodinium sp. CCMP2456]|nr:ACBP2 [Symbiodinium sp. CCMP2456]
MRGQFCLFTVICWLRGSALAALRLHLGQGGGKVAGKIVLRGAVDLDQCEEVSRPAGTGLLQAKSHLDPSTSAGSNAELAWRPRHVALNLGRLQEVESESDLAILGESWQGALQLQELGANNSLNRLAAQCRKQKRKAKAQVPRVPLEVAQQLREVARADVIRVGDDPCPGELTLWQFFHNETTTS